MITLLCSSCELKAVEEQSWRAQNTVCKHPAGYPNGFMFSSSDRCPYIVKKISPAEKCARICKHCGKEWGYHFEDQCPDAETTFEVRT